MYSVTMYYFFFIVRNIWFLNTLLSELRDDDDVFTILMEVSYTFKINYACSKKISRKL